MGYSFDYYGKQRVQMALVGCADGFSVECGEHGWWHYVPDLNPLIVDMNGATRICETLRRLVADGLRRGKSVRIVRQGSTHLEPEWRANVRS